MLRVAAPLLAGRPPASLLFAARRAATASPFALLVPRHTQRLSCSPALRTSTTYSSRSTPLVRFSTSSSPSSSSTPTPTPPTGAAIPESQQPVGHFARLMDLWRKYGAVAIGTYFGMYGAVLGSIYVAIDLGWVSTAKPARDGEPDDDEFNVVAATNKFVTFAENLGIAKYLEVEHVNAKTGTFLIAWIATKFTEPLRLAITLAITPRIARFVGRAPQLKPKASRKP
ncbi:hypothetical protein PybrP1_010916 [[Pythium] brassicae (nom. inval.)]|nr:hypothetical protein PybrP1_010916 [[Pythium] brassicae (nom. inval.)]